MKKIVKKIIKSLIILLILFSIVSTIIFTSISSSNEPRKWVPYHNGMFGFAEKHYQNINGYCVFFNRYNFTESQGDISIGFFSCINGNTTGTQLRGSLEDDMLVNIIVETMENSITRIIRLFMIFFTIFFILSSSFTY